MPSNNCHWNIFHDSFRTRERKKFWKKIFAPGLLTGFTQHLFLIVLNFSLYPALSKVEQGGQCRKIFRKGAGFTLAELLLVVGIITLIAALSIPVGVNFYQSQLVGEAARDLYDVLTRAQHQAIIQKNDSPFGVKIIPPSYTIFQGASYATRTVAEDETFTFANTVTVSGLNEITFQKRDGRPTVTGTITLSFGNTTHTLSINSQGVIDIQ